MEKLTPEQIERLKTTDAKKYYEYANYFYVHDLQYYKDFFEQDIKRRIEADNAQKRMHKLLTWGSVGLIFFALLVFAVFSGGEGGRSKVENSSWDGSVKQCKKYLVSRLNDADSYESVEWYKVTETGNGYLVKHTYRARNGFGAKVLSTVLFKMDKDGDVIEMVKLE